MVGLEAQVRVLAENRHEFLQTYELLSRQSCPHTACISQTLFEKVDKPNQFLWVEHWVDLKSLEDHLQSEKCRMLLGAIKVLGELERMQVLDVCFFIRCWTFDVRCWTFIFQTNPVSINATCECLQNNLAPTGGPAIRLYVT